MIAASVGFDLLFLVHVLAAVATFTVIAVMRAGAVAVAGGADAVIQRRRFPERRNWAARVVHLLVLSGLAVSATGGSADSLRRPFVIVGLLCYLAIAGHLEARTLPLERTVANEIARDGVAEVAKGRQLTRSIDVIAVLLAIALISMLVQY